MFLQATKRTVTKNINNVVTSRMLSSQSAEHIKTTLKNATAVCFDVDSTVLVNEGLDDLAAFLGASEEVAAITREAMGGNMPFEVALSKRLDIVKPSKQDIENFLEAHPPKLTNGIHDFINALRKNGSLVYLISGGFEPLILPAAKILDVPPENVFANRFIHDDNGIYEKFDETAFTSSSGGKARGIAHIQEINGGADKCKVVMVGDGANDLEAKPPAEIVIGYGGIVERDIVKEKADYFITDFQEVIDFLEE
eukprot:g7006.t1